MVSTLAEYENRRHKMLAYLGSKCAICGIEDDLQIDHVDASTKKFDVSKNWSRTWGILEDELNKCQLLCVRHHKEKTKHNGEGGGGQNKWKDVKHGTVWAYNKYRCRCERCKEAKAVSRAKEYEILKQRDVAQFG